MRQLLDEASKGGYGVGAFNVNNMEQIQSIMEAAKETNSPVIIQASRGARAYSQDRFLYHLMLAATEIYPEIPTVLHLDSSLHQILPSASWRRPSFSCSPLPCLSRRLSWVR